MGMGLVVVSLLALAAGGQEARTSASCHPEELAPARPACPWDRPCFDKSGPSSWIGSNVFSTSSHWSSLFLSYTCTNSSQQTIDTARDQLLLAIEAPEQLSGFWVVTSLELLIK